MVSMYALFSCYDGLAVCDPNVVNLLATDFFFFQILAHPVFNM